MSRPIKLQRDNMFSKPESSGLAVRLLFGFTTFSSARSTLFPEPAPCPTPPAVADEAEPVPNPLVLADGLPPVKLLFPACAKRGTVKYFSKLIVGGEARETTR